MDELALMHDLAMAALGTIPIIQIWHLTRKVKALEAKLDGKVNATDHHHSVRVLWNTIADLRVDINHLFVDRFKAVTADDSK